MNRLVKRTPTAAGWEIHEIHPDANVSFGCMNKEMQPAHEISVWVDGGIDTAHYVLHMDRDTAKTVIRHLTRMLKINYPGA